MKSICALLLVLFAGCIRGDAALPIVFSAPIPDTEFEVHLGGPATNGDFGYYVTSPRGINYGYRSLGPLKPNQTTPAVLESLGNGIFRIQWGTPPDTVYAIIDFKAQRFVKDSNTANPKDQPFNSR